MIYQIGYYVYNMVLTIVPVVHNDLLDNLFLLHIVEFLDRYEDCFLDTSSLLNEICSHTYTSKMSN